MKHFYISIEKNIEVFEFYKPLWKVHGIDGIRAETMNVGIKKAIEIEESAIDELCFITVSADDIDYLPQLSILRKEINAPILIPTSKYNEQEHHKALEMGADFYGQFCDTPENNIKGVCLVINNIERRNKKIKPSNKLTINDDILMVHGDNKAFINNVEIRFSGSEIKILRYLTVNRGIVLSHEQIYDKANGNKQNELTLYSIYGLMKRLRKKMRDATGVDYIETVRYMGYRLRTYSEINGMNL